MTISQTANNNKQTCMLDSLIDKTRQADRKTGSWPATQEEEIATQTERQAGIQLDNQTSLLVIADLRPEGQAGVRTNLAWHYGIAPGSGQSA